MWYADLGNGVQKASQWLAESGPGTDQTRGLLALATGLQMCGAGLECGGWR